MSGKTAINFLWIFKTCFFDWSGHFINSVHKLYSISSSAVVDLLEFQTDINVLKSLTKGERKGKLNLMTKGERNYVCRQRKAKIRPTTGEKSKWREISLIARKKWREIECDGEEKGRGNLV